MLLLEDDQKTNQNDMDFSRALGLLKGKYRLRRKHWTNEYVYVDDNRLWFRTFDGRKVAYNSPSADIMSEDWHIYSDLEYEDPERVVAKLFCAAASEVEAELETRNIQWFSVRQYPDHPNLSCYLCKDSICAIYDSRNCLLYLMQNTSFNQISG